MIDTDKDGNRLFLHDGGTSLKLASEPRMRTILSFQGGKMCKWLSKKNIMNVGGGMIGFNYHALKMIMANDMIKDKNIYLRYGRKTFRLPIKAILEHKEFLHFKEEGFELQCFYPLSKAKKLLVEGRI